jgi:hypothetical protein
VDTRRCEECVALDVVTGEVGYQRSDLIGDPSATVVISMRVGSLGKEGRWCAGVQKEERKPVVCSVSPEISSLRRLPWSE